MHIDVDAKNARLDSNVKPSTARLAQQGAKEFIDAILALPINYEITLFGLQGDMGIRLSCERRGKFPSQLDFSKELAIAKELGWITEGDEDTKLTAKYQSRYRNADIRYGRTFTRTARSTTIKAQRDEFVARLLAPLK